MAYKIDRLYVVAGSRCIGKSTFLQNPAMWLDPEILPKPLQRMMNDPIDVYLPSEISKRRRKVKGDAVLHVDLMVPIDGVERFGLDNYERIINPQMFNGWKGMECIRDAKEVHVLTLFAPRQVVFRRWLTRVSGFKQLSVRRNVVALYGDATENAAPLRALYQAWAGFVDAFHHQSHCGLDASGKTYRFHERFSPDMITDR